MNPDKIYPRGNDSQTVYLKNVVTDPGITVGDYTMYNDFVNDPRLFEKNNVLYHYPVNQDRLIIGKFCSIACGAKFLLTSAYHRQSSLSTYPFPIFYEEWGLDIRDVAKAMEPMYTTAPDGERSGMGFSFMEAFMDQVEVVSAPGSGTTVTMRKKIGR